MQRAELKQIRGIGDAMCERLRQDHGIETIADLARLNDTEVDELQRALQVGRSFVRTGDVARWRDQASKLVSAAESAAKGPLATFVVEAWEPVGDPSDRLSFVVHHIEADETLETSAPQPTIDVVVRWMQERVSRPASSPATAVPVERLDRAHDKAPEQLPPPSSGRRGRLRITGVEVRDTEGHVINGPATSLLDDPVEIVGGGALVFVGQVSLEGAEYAVSCQMRCRLHQIGSKREVSFTWCGETMVAPGLHSTTMSSAPVSMPTGVYRGELFAEDRRQGVRRAFCELPLLVIN